MNALAQTTPAHDTQTALVPTFQAVIGGIPMTVCDARALHAFLGNSYQFTHWIKDRIEQYGFQENQDFVCVSKKVETQRKDGQRGISKRTDYHLTLGMAKELSMVERRALSHGAYYGCEELAA